MTIELGRLIKQKKEWDSENVLCPINTYDRIKYLNYRMLIRVISILPFFYFFGLNLCYNCNYIDEIIKYSLTLLLYLILIFYSIQLPHELIHLFLLPKPLENDNKILFLNNKRIFTSILTEDYSLGRLIISLIIPFIIFTIIPLIFLLLFGFNLLIFALTLANTILCSEDILNIILLLFKTENTETYTLYTLNNIYGD